MTSLAKLRRTLLTDPEVKAEYDRLGPIFAVVGEMIEARQAAGLTQADIAARMGTTQSVVARLENARHMPTFDMVARYAAAGAPSIPPVKPAFPVSIRTILPGPAGFFVSRTSSHRSPDAESSISRITWPSRCSTGGAPAVAFWPAAGSAATAASTASAARIIAHAVTLPIPPRPFLNDCMQISASYY